MKRHLTFGELNAFAIFFLCPRHWNLFKWDQERYKSIIPKPSWQELMSLKEKAKIGD
ncbi:hypothetical protein KMC73_gp25 [Paenibacillus phage Wanderer]|uniref:Uncharacterized protein n=2 Tax=Wanderervirus wanderer TaxID=2845749 RepID=A0A345ARI8_9CAUD|nr:hypothetical protein KMC73_gp25 [Paenibacillus phage Wanderer]AXF39442.1 hypothetical protein WANDERER_25 [Paenibacillus phage Wanderer]AXF40325.1 hypothetical protein LINCOLNB_25 [Paenibacillus phage LincolnB]